MDGAEHDGVGFGYQRCTSPGVFHRPFAIPVDVFPTLSLGHIRIPYATRSLGQLRIPYRILGRINACALHDYIVSRRIEKQAAMIDVIHGWPARSASDLPSSKKA